MADIVSHGPWAMPPWGIAVTMYSIAAAESAWWAQARFLHQATANQPAVSTSTACQPAAGIGPPTGESIATIATTSSSSARSPWRTPGPTRLEGGGGSRSTHGSASAANTAVSAQSTTIASLSVVEGV